MFITVLYTCSTCGVVDREVIVPARESPDDDVAEYVKEMIGDCVVKDHSRVSPVCFATKIDQIKIPMNEDDPNHWIGKAQS